MSIEVAWITQSYSRVVRNNLVVIIRLVIQRINRHARLCPEKMIPPTVMCVTEASDRSWAICRSSAGEVSATK